MSETVPKVGEKWFNSPRKTFGTFFYRAFLPIVAAARLAEGIPELQDWLLAQAYRVQNG